MANAQSLILAAPAAPEVQAPRARSSLALACAVAALTAVYLAIDHPPQDGATAAETVSNKFSTFLIGID